MHSPVVDVGRRLDPVTGDIYHIQFHPPSDPKVAKRLIQRSDDSLESAKVRLQLYRGNSSMFEASQVQQNILRM